MVASLVRLFHSGLQDAYLMGKEQPNIRAFVYVYNTKGRFTTQWHRLDFSQKPDFGSSVRCTLPVKGELLSRLYLVTTMPDIYSAQAQARLAAIDFSGNPLPFAGPTYGWTNSLGHVLVEEASVYVGGSRMDVLSTRLLEIKDEFITPLEKVPLVNDLLGRVENGFGPRSLGHSSTPTTVATPLPFWFSRGDLGAVLPIDALYVDSVDIQIKIRGLEGCYYTDARPSALVNQYGPNDASGNPYGPPPVLQPPENPVCKQQLYPILNASFFKEDPSGNILLQGLRGPTEANMPTYSCCTCNSGVACVDESYCDEEQVFRYVQYEKKFKGMDPSGLTVAQIPNVKMPGQLNLQDCYIMAEYIYLDKPEANKFRLGSIQVPIVQHYAMEPAKTKGFSSYNMELNIPNPVRNLFFYAQREETSDYNAYFLCTRDLSDNVYDYAPWWPNASGLNNDHYHELHPGFYNIDSEPFNSLQLVYENNLVKLSTENCALYRCILPSYEMTKSPWVNKYMYCIPFGLQQQTYAPSMPLGHANYNKIKNANLVFGLRPRTTSPRTVPNLIVYVWAETYNMFVVYGGRGSLLFGY